MFYSKAQQNYVSVLLKYSFQMTWICVVGEILLSNHKSIFDILIDCFHHQVTVTFISCHCSWEAAVRWLALIDSGEDLSWRQGWPRLSVTSYMSWNSFILRPMTSKKSSTRRNSSLMLGPSWETQRRKKKKKKKRKKDYTVAEYCE